MRRGPEPGLGAVDFNTSGTVADEAEVADSLIGANAVEDERGPRINAVREAAIAAGAIESHRHEADAGEPLGWPR